MPFFFRVLLRISRAKNLMIYEINETHDPNLKSWVESANDPNTDFPIQNLPFCRFRPPFHDFGNRLGVRIGDYVLDLEELPGLKQLSWLSLIHISEPTRPY